MSLPVVAARDQKWRVASDKSGLHLIARSDKSVAYVTINKRLNARRFVLLKLTTDRQEASRGLFATAEVIVFINSNDKHMTN